MGLRAEIQMEACRNPFSPYSYRPQDWLRPGPGPGHLRPDSFGRRVRIHWLLGPVASPVLAGLDTPLRTVAATDEKLRGPALAFTIGVGWASLLVRMVVCLLLVPLLALFWAGPGGLRPVHCQCKAAARTQVNEGEGVSALTLSSLGRCESAIAPTTK